MRSVLFLASGGGGNMKFLDIAVQSGLVNKLRIGVVADRECGSLDYAERHNMAYCIVSYDRSKGKELIAVIEKFSPDVIVTNWNKILGEDVVHRYRGKLVNLHYSLLPAFGGMIGIEPIEAAYEKGCKFVGPTCHLVDESVDSGYILSQAVFSTECPLDEAINQMFRKGCLVLLKGLETVLKENLACHRCVVDTAGYSPCLGFEESLFSEKFWDEVSLA